MPVRDRPVLRPSELRELTADLPEWMRAVAAAVGAACASATIVVTVVFFTWLAGAPGSASAGQTLAAGLGAWLLAHGASLFVGDARIDLTPWLLTLLPLFAARWSAARLTSREDTQAHGARVAGVRRDVVESGAAFVAGYVLSTLVLLLIARLGGVQASLLGSLLGGAALAVLAYVLALASERRIGNLAPDAVASYRERVPAWVRAAVRPALWGALAALAAGLLLVVVSLVANAGRIATLYRELDPGVVGGVAVSLGQVAYLPTFAVWALAWLAGPGFGIGTGSSMTWATSAPGLVPLVPAFAALPDPGPMPPWAIVGALVPVACGVLVGVLAVRRLGPTDLRRRAGCAALACVLAALLLTLAAAAATGPLGAARLTHVGVDTLLVGGALLVELLAGAALVVLASSVRVRRAPTRENRAS